MHVPALHWMSILLFLGVAQNAAFAFALTKDGKSDSAMRVLAVLLCVLSVPLLDGLFIETNWYFAFPHLIGLSSLTCFLYGPLTYLHVRMLTVPEEPAFTWGRLPHLIPFGMKIFRLIPFFLAPADEKIKVLKLSLSGAGTQLSFDADPRFLVPLIHAACYLVASVRLVVIYSEKRDRGLTSHERNNLGWLRDYLIVLFCLGCFYAAARLVSPHYLVFRESMNIVRLVTAAGVFVMGMKGIKRPQPFAAPVFTLAADNATRGMLADDAGASGGLDAAAAACVNKGKYLKSSLTDEQAAHILRRLTMMMDGQKPFLEPEITLPELAKKVSVSSNHLSQVLNGKLNKSFLDFVNEYRVWEAKRLLGAPEASHLSILGIAMDAGFNSKNAFYSAFKKCTGMTPTQYRRCKIKTEQMNLQRSSDRM